jgi:3'-phosphoadenosine 5'-phosphosulfate (PAPS) 3'-phosphatase
LPTGGEAISAVETDRHAFGELFMRVTEHTDAPPLCDVLLIYCHVGLDGRLKNTNRSLREVIRDSGAKIVIVASENQADAYIKAGHVEAYGRANIVMTLTRNGASFGAFTPRGREGQNWSVVSISSFCGS